MKTRKTHGEWPRLHTIDCPNAELTQLLEFITSRCFVHDSQQSTVRGYLAAVHFFHKMFAGWELALSNCMIFVAGKGMSHKKK